MCVQHRDVHPRSSSLIDAAKGGYQAIVEDMIGFEIDASDEEGHSDLAKRIRDTYL